MVDTVAAGELAVDAALVVGSARTWVQLREKTGESGNPSLEIKWLRRWQRCVVAVVETAPKE